MKEKMPMEMPKGKNQMEHPPSTKECPMPGMPKPKGKH